MKINFKDLIIDEEDRKLFLVEDNVLKPEALRHSILPRLENILYLIIEYLNKIYQIDVLDKSKISKSPNFRKSNRKDPIKHNYQACSVWLNGRIKEDYWKELIKTSGGFSQHTPLRFQIQLSEEGILCYLAVYPHLKLLDKSYNLFDDWMQNNFLKIFPLIQEAGAYFDFFCSETCKPFTSLNSYFSCKKNEGIAGCWLYSETFTYPLDEKQFKKIRKFFLYLFPVYQTFIDICKGDPNTFEMYQNKIQQYQFDLINNETEEVKAAVELSQSANLGELIDSKIKVLPGIRWQVFQRDNWKCVACGRSSEDGIILHVDHIIPRSKGGQNILSNYQTLCNICNIGKSNKDDTNIKLFRE